MSDQQISANWLQFGRMLRSVRTRKHLTLSRLAGGTVQLTRIQLIEFEAGRSFPSHLNVLDLADVLRLTKEETADLLHAAGYRTTPDDESLVREVLTLLNSSTLPEFNKQNIRDILVSCIATARVVIDELQGKVA